MFAAYKTMTGRASRARLRKALERSLTGLIIVVLVAAPQAQTIHFSAAPGAGANDAADTPTDIDLLVGRSTILNVGSPIARVSLTVPDIADAMVTAPTQLLIHGKQPGTISLFVWDKAGSIRTFEVNVRRDLTALVEHYKQLFPGEPIDVIGSGKDVVVSGTVSSKYVVEKAGDVAGGYVDKKENVVNLLQQQQGVASNQVMLRVRFAEVSRTALQELGASFFTGPTGYKNWITRSTTGQFAAPNFTDMERTADLDDNLVSAEGKWSLSDFLNVFVFNNKYNIGTVVRALSEKGLFQSLAEPNLIATNGKEASFLAGGEYPYPIAQPTSGGGVSYTISFKEFGVRLSFTPTVMGGDLINLKVKPEVSALDFSNAITLGGFRVPALSTRRTETEVELRDGQTFAIAGLMNNSVTDTMRKIPGIGDIPILGWLFKSKAMAKNQTELVVMITPTIIRRGQMGVSEGLPSPVEPFLGAPSKRLPPPPPYVGSPRYPANRPAPRDGNMNNNDAAAAAQPALEPGQNAAAPAQSSLAGPVSNAPQAQPAAGPAPVLTREQREALQRAQEQERRAAEELREEELKAAEAAARLKAAEDRQRAIDDKRREEEERAAARQAAEDKVRADKLAKEREKREAVAARKNAEIARKKAEEDQKRQKALDDAAARLRAAQAEYQAQVEKTKSKGGVK
jgi:pilus assembly protein CpaC